MQTPAAGPSGGMPRAIVDHADQCPPAVLDFDGDVLRPGVDRVLDQLLDHRRRPLDHFARGDAVDQRRRKLLNPAKFHGKDYRGIKPQDEAVLLRRWARAGQIVPPLHEVFLLGASEALPPAKEPSQSPAWPG